MTLVISIIGSLIAGFILANLPVINTLIIRLPLKKIGIIGIYSNQESAQKKMLSDFQNSRTISVFAVKGGTFSEPNSKKAPFYKEVTDKNKNARYIISSEDNRYLGFRGKQLNMDLKGAVDLSISNFIGLKKINDNIKLRFHREAIKIRIIIFEHIMYLSFHGKDLPSRESPMFRIEKDSILFEIFSSQFDEKWEAYEKTEYME